MHSLLKNHGQDTEVQPHAPIVLIQLVMPDGYTVEAHDEYSTARTICSRYLLLRRPTAASARCRRMRCSHVVADAAPVDPSCGGAPSSFKHPALRSSFELALLRMVAEVGESSTLNVLHAASARRKITKAIEAKAKSGGAAAERALPNQSHCTKRPVPGTHSKQTKPTRWCTHSRPHWSVNARVFSAMTGEPIKLRDSRERVEVRTCPLLACPQGV
jgi:hypothetical protein